MIKPPRAHKFPRTKEVETLFLMRCVRKAHQRKHKPSQFIDALVARPFAKLPGTFNVPMPDARNSERHLDHLYSWRYAQVCLEQAPKLYLLAHRLTGQDAHGREVFSWLASFDEGQDILAELVENRIEYGRAYVAWLQEKWISEVAKSQSSRVELSKESIANSRFVMRTDVHMGHTYERRIL